MFLYLTFNYPIVMIKSELYFIKNFRQASPYISQHRGKTAVFYLPSKIIQDNETLSQFSQDVVLLNNLGIKIVLVLGASLQINNALKNKNIAWESNQNIRITDAEQIQTIQETIGLVRSKLEAVFSQAASMQHSNLSLISGNWVTAKPKGIINGVDFKQTGSLRSINSKAINECLDAQQICLLTPLAYSSEGKVYNLNTLEQAYAIAESLPAYKLMIFTDEENINKLPKSLNILELKKQLEKNHSIELQALLEKSLHSSSNIKRIHLMSQETPSSMLLELFTRDGIGTLIYTDRYHQLSTATTSDISGIIKLITPLEKQGILVKRTVNSIKQDIKKFIVAKIDDEIIGCAAIYSITKDTAELASLVVDPTYQGDDIGKQLVSTVIERVKQEGYKELFILTTQTNDWFKEQGFKDASLSSLPTERQKNYNQNRKSKILIKKI